MTADTIKDWLVPISSFIAIVSTSIAIWLSLKEYRLKLQAETRLTESARAETDIRLLELFTNILYIATGRRGDPIYVEGIIDLLTKNNAFSGDDFADLSNLKNKLQTASFVSPVPGNESVVAAIASISTLAKRHPVLLEPATEALNSLLSYRPEIADKYLNSVISELKLKKEDYIKESNDSRKNS